MGRIGKWIAAASAIAFVLAAAVFSSCNGSGSSSSGSSTPGEISGTASDQSSGKVSGIRVVIPGLMLRTVTDSSGNFAFTGIPPGVYTVIAEDNAYRLQERKVITVPPGGISKAAFSLLPDGTVGTVVGQVPRSALDNNGRTNTAMVRGNFVFLGDHFGGVPIIDATDPTNPIVRSILLPQQNAPPLETGKSVMAYCTEDGNYLVTVNSVDGANFHDITDKSSPVHHYQVYSVDNTVGGQDPVSRPNYPYPLAPGQFILSPVSVNGIGNTVYIGGFHVLLVYDITDRQNPVLREGISTTGDGADIEIRGNLLLLSGSVLDLFDISDPKNPQFLGSYSSASGWAPTGAARVDDVVGISIIGGVGIDGIEFLDISNPSAISKIVSFPVQSQGLDSSWEGYFYAATENTMTVYRVVPTPLSVEEVYSAPVVTDYAMNVAVSGDYAYVSDKMDGLKIVKIR